MKRNRVRVCSRNQNGNAMRYHNKSLMKYDRLVVYFLVIKKTALGHSLNING
jgi:hypothetical protein